MGICQMNVMIVWLAIERSDMIKSHENDLNKDFKASKDAPMVGTGWKVPLQQIFFVQRQKVIWRGDIVISQHSS